MEIESSLYIDLYKDLWMKIIEKDFKNRRPPQANKDYSRQIWLLRSKTSDTTVNNYLLKNPENGESKDQRYFYLLHLEAIRNVKAGRPGKKIEIGDKALYNIFYYLENPVLNIKENEPPVEQVLDVLERYISLKRYKRHETTSKEQELTNLSSSVQKVQSAFIFENTFWSLYESFGSKIARRPLRFAQSKDKEHCSVVLKPFQNKVGDWVGEAYYTSDQGCLIITLNNSVSGVHYNHLLLRIENKSEKQILCAGHLSYCSDNRNHNIITKNILLYKDDTLNEENSSEEHDYDSEKIPKEVIRFFKTVRPTTFGFYYSLSVFNLESLNDALDKREKGEPGYEESMD